MESPHVRGICALGLSMVAQKSILRGCLQKQMGECGKRLLILLRILHDFVYCESIRAILVRSAQ